MQPVKTSPGAVPDALFNLLFAAQETAEPAECVYCAFMLCGEQTPDDMTSEAISDARKLARRIYDMSCHMDDGRFTVFDYADAICNYPVTMVFDDLLALTDDEFSNLMLYIAQSKRDVYSTDPVEINAKAAQDVLKRLSERPVIVNATFTSVWDSSASVVQTSCKVDLTTRHVFDIATADTPEITTLDKETITLPDGQVFPVKRAEEAEPNDFWYD